MLHVLKRAISILERDGVGGFINKSKNYLRSYVSYKFSPEADKKNTNWHKYIKELDARAEVLTCTPWKIGLESTSVCNLQCIMCPHVFAHPRSGKHFNIKSLEGLEQYIAAAGEFQLMGGGEPLISPAFWKIMGYIKEHHKSTPRISISSNGAALNKHFAAKLLDSPLQEISFSLDAANPATYKKIRNADFGRTIENIKYFLRRKKEKGQSTPFVMLNMTLMRENIDELVPFIELAHELQVDAVQFWPLHDYDLSRTGDWTVERNGWTFVYREQMLGQNEEEAAFANAIIDKGIERAGELGMEVIWPVGGRTRIVAQSENTHEVAADASAKVETSAQPLTNSAVDDMDVAPHGDLRECVAPWEWMAITEAGEVRPCCYIVNPLGNLKESSPEEIWNGAEYREMRRDLARGVLPRQCRNAACKYVRSARNYGNM